MASKPAEEGWSIFCFSRMIIGGGVGVLQENRVGDDALAEPQRQTARPASSSALCANPQIKGWFNGHFLSHSPARTRSAFQGPRGTTLVNASSPDGLHDGSLVQGRAGTLRASSGATSTASRSAPSTTSKSVML